MRSALVLATLVSSTLTAQDARTQKSAAADCAALATVAIPDVKITAAVAVAAAPTANARGPRVAHCKVTGVAGTETRFSLLLPDDWNRRFFMGGAGGFAGSLENMAVSSVNSGYATVGTDAGHVGVGILARWALNNRERQESYGSLGVHRTAVAARALIAAYYGSAPVKSYFMGCSNGGRQALMEAQRFPDDFDGIVAIAPAAEFTEIGVTFVRNLQAQYPTGDFSKPTITADNLTLLQGKVLERCDARDGLADNILDDPRQCDFALASVASCPSDVAGPTCLTNAQRAAIEQVLSPVVINGRTVQPGQPLGNEAAGGGWSAWITGVLPDVLAATGGKAPNVQAAFGTELFKYFVFGDSAWDYRTYDLSRWEADTKQAAAMINAGNPDLGAFRKRGGKLILAHGWSDPALNALSTIRYYDAVLARDKGAARDVRLFMMPGVLHCAGGPGCDDVNWYAPIADWVERGKAPESVIAMKASPVKSRPLCAYPKRAVYDGKGDANSADSFTCK